MAGTTFGAWIGVSEVLWGLPPAILCLKATFLCLFSFPSPFPPTAWAWRSPAEGGALAWPC